VHTKSEKDAASVSRSSDPEDIRRIR